MNRRGYGEVVRGLPLFIEVEDGSLTLIRGATHDEVSQLDSDPRRRADQVLVERVTSALGDALDGNDFEMPSYSLERASSFARDVLRYVREIPRGWVSTYRDVGSVFSPNHARAIGSCVASNPLPILFPCHRVVAADLKLGGYSLFEGGRGVDFKRELLAKESDNTVDEPIGAEFPLYPASRVL